MNHYIENIAAKNLHLMEVIQPRLASRFEPAPQHILPAQRGLQSFVSKDREPANAADRYSQDHDDRDASDHYSPDRYARVAARNIVGSSSALEVRDPDPSGHESIVETEKSFSSPVRGEGDTPASFEVARQTPSAPEEMTSGRSSIYRFSGLASPPETAPVPGTVQKVLEKNGLENRPPMEGPAPFAPTEEEQISRELSYGGKSTERITSDGRRSDKIVLFPSKEEKPVFPEQKPNLDLKSLDRLASRIVQREEEIMPIASIEVNEKKSGESGAKRDIRHKVVEPIAGIKPLMPSISPVMAASQPNAKSYFGPKRNEISEKVAKPETSASVQVTIGRIEIRAAPATTTPQRKRTEPPVMSLKDYLKNKRGSL